MCLTEFKSLYSFIILRLEFSLSSRLFYQIEIFPLELNSLQFDHIKLMSVAHEKF